MSAHVLLNLLNELEKKIRCSAQPRILSVSPNEFNKFNNTGKRMQNSTLSYDTKLYLIAVFISKCQDFANRKCAVLIDVKRITDTCTCNVHI